MSSSLPLLTFVLIGLFSPGPNVVMLTASGARFGFRATLPHLLGVPIGTGLIAATSALGLGVVLLSTPKLTLIFQIAAAIWILWLAWRTAQAARAGRASDNGKPLTFVEAILFQVINAKLWAVAIAASAGFSIGLSLPAEALRLFAAFTCLNLAVCLFWTTAGHLLADLLQSETNWRRFMLVMAFVMASTVIMIFI